MNFLGPIGFLELMVIAAFFLIFALWFWALVDVLRSNFRDTNTKIIWLLVIIFVAFVGPILYLTIGRGQRVASS